MPVQLPEPRHPGEDPSLVLALDVGPDGLVAEVRDPDLRMRAELTGLDGDPGRLVVGGTGSFVEHALVHDGWRTAVAAVADAAARRGLHPAVVAHRLAGDGALPAGPCEADDALLGQLRTGADPRERARQLDAVGAARACWPGAVQVLCPDTVFHRGLPDEAATLPLPAADRGRGLRRRGAAGLALQSVVDALPGLGPAVVVHLDHRSEVTAVDGGRPRSTTTALGPAGGLPSATGSGDLDPEVVLRVVSAHGGSVATARRVLGERSGLAALSGGDGDLRRLLDTPGAAADLACRVFVQRVAMAVAGAVTTLDRWDALVFSGHLGAGSAELRERVCARLLPLRPGAAVAAGRYSDRLRATGLRVVVTAADVGAELDRLARGVVRGRAPAGAREQDGAPLAGRP